MSVPHANIAVFVPHNGCPHMCSFCNQRTITGKQSQPSCEDVKAAIETALAHPKKDAVTELAFFGGSFTAIDRDYMVSLLEAAMPYCESGRIGGIRCSTRPDCVDSGTVSLLKEYHVTAIELGAQSMRDHVLAANNRGHTARDVELASEIIRSAGIELGLQMMTGLYMSSPEDDIYTAERLIELKPATARIYPTVVLRGTELERLYLEGKYCPPDAYQSAPLCARLMTMFDGAGVCVIRVGLHAERELERGYVAGAYHPAMRELCESALYLEKMRALLDCAPDAGGTRPEHAGGTRPEYAGGKICFGVHPRELSKALGQKRSNIERLRAEGYDVRIVADGAAAPGDIVLKQQKESYEGTF